METAAAMTTTTVATTTGIGLVCLHGKSKEADKHERHQGFEVRHIA